MALIDLNLKPSRSQLRFFAILLIIFACIVAGLVYFRTENRQVTIGILIAGFVLGGIGLIQPQWLRIVYVVWMILAFPIGWTVSHIVMALVYYLIFTPCGLLMKLKLSAGTH